MKKRPFGRLEDGTPVEEVVLESADAAVSILNYGCVLRDWRVDGPAGRSLPMVLGFGTIGDYVQHARGHGMICGRVANRTAQGRFVLEGQRVQLTRNEGPHHLHGGAIGAGDLQALQVQRRLERGGPGAKRHQRLTPQFQRAGERFA